MIAQCQYQCQIVTVVYTLKQKVLRRRLLTFVETLKIVSKTFFQDH